MGKSRSSLLIAIGAAVFIVGSALTFLVAHHGHSASPSVKTAATVPAAANPGDVAPAAAAGTAAAPSFTIPAGKQAVAGSVSYINGVAGYVKPGDKVNVFGTIKPGSPVPKGLPTTPAVKMILPDVQVLSTSAPAGAGNITFILALTPADAEQVVYLQSFEGLYFSLARTDQGIISTPGRSAGTAF